MTSVLGLAPSAKNGVFCQKSLPILAVAQALSSNLPSITMGVSVSTISSLNISLKSSTLGCAMSIVNVDRKRKAINDRFLTGDSVSFDYLTAR